MPLGERVGDGLAGNDAGVDPVTLAPLVAAEVVDGVPAFVAVGALRGEVTAVGMPPTLVGDTAPSNCRLSARGPAAPVGTDAAVGASTDRVAVAVSGLPDDPAAGGVPIGSAASASGSVPRSPVWMGVSPPMRLVPVAAAVGVRAATADGPGTAAAAPTVVEGLGTAVAAISVAAAALAVGAAGRIWGAHNAAKSVTAPAAASMPPARR
jgi:hypothetical protein